MRSLTAVKRKIAAGRLDLAVFLGGSIALGAQAVGLDCTALRCSSSEAKTSTSSTKPRRASAAATPVKSLRSSFGSSTNDFLE